MTQEQTPSAAAGGSFDVRAFDRLADGELPAAERRQLLSQLDQLPNGWRRCALAFLEAQALREILGEERPAKRAAPPVTVAQEPDVLSFQANTPPPRKWQLPANMPSVYATAALLLVSFGLGISLGPWGLGSGDNAGRSFPGQGTGVGIASQGNSLGKANPWTGEATSIPVRMREMAIGGDETGQGAIRVPVLEGLNAEQQRRWIEQLPSPLPDHVRRDLQRRGMTVQEHQRMVPMSLPDGRQVMVPMIEVEVVPVGAPELQ